MNDAFIPSIFFHFPLDIFKEMLEIRKETCYTLSCLKNKLARGACRNAGKKVYCGWFSKRVLEMPVYRFKKRLCVFIKAKRGSHGYSGSGTD
jgi:hypothetical protein